MLSVGYIAHKSCVVRTSTPGQSCLHIAKLSAVSSIAFVDFLRAAMMYILRVVVCATAVALVAPASMSQVEVEASAGAPEVRRTATLRTREATAGRASPF